MKLLKHVEPIAILGRTDQDFIDYASKNFVEQIIDGEGREGILAFIEKRKPEWKK